MKNISIEICSFLSGKDHFRADRPFWDVTKAFVKANLSLWKFYDGLEEIMNCFKEYKTLHLMLS